ncbi:hypothetical protein CAPI_06250 [Corynebacterium capitovis DSM 44611]|uniref:cell wall-binding repeat 2 family protein n=1 Tax=Corynebacterium capitovis TaxID=131081 RepID=UPI0003690996|nr:cell wall-binding repeat 2 family protein [Corynebacterium capitovis]WKD57791.1 hypothetical protein CAPI_06250 [Corynebacterium capitovis DSM 44611]
MTTRRVISAVIIAAGVSTLAGCGGGSSTSSSSVADSPLDTHGQEVLADADGTGVEVSQRLYSASSAVVIAGEGVEDQLHAAAIATKLGVPMLTRLPGTDAAVDAEVTRLGAQRVITVPGDDKELADTPTPQSQGTSALDTVVALQPSHPQNRQLPPFLATEQTSLPAVATARAAGANVLVSPAPDPRATSETMRTVTAQDTIALGRQWGTSGHYADRASLAKNGELPGGGGLVFPGRRMVALYGHPSGPALGVMGEQGPAEAAQLAQQYAASYQALTPDPVIPAFEIIVTVASGSPGPDGNFSNESDPAEIVPYVDAITQAGGYAVLDLQPGQGNFLEQTKLYADLLARPNVGLALDAEWKLNPGEQPLSRVGSATSAEINEVADWLAQFTRERNLPQKAFVLHQFQVAMFPDRENIRTDHPELAYVLHADGHGSAGQKFETWNVLRQDLDPGFFLAWKNFIDEDMPMFTPEQTFADVAPQPWFVSYQ